MPRRGRALQARVVRDADTGQDRDFLAAQPGDTPRSIVREPDVGGLEPCPPEGEELADLVARVHRGVSVDARPSGVGDPAGVTLTGSPNASRAVLSGFMQATLMYAAGDVRVEDVPDPSIVDPTDAIVRVTSACICGSDLWPYADLDRTTTGRPMGHEAIGLVEDVGADVRSVKPGDLVVMPFAFSDGTCAFCSEGLHTACVHGGFFDGLGTGAAQAEAVRVPVADGTLFALPVGEEDALMPSLLGRARHRPPRRSGRRRQSGRLGGCGR